MKTTIDNRQKVFQVVSAIDYTQRFCNLEDLNTVIEVSFLEGYFIIYEFWNNKPRKVSKKSLTEMFEANGIEQEFNY